MNFYSYSCLFLGAFLLFPLCFLLLSQILPFGSARAKLKEVLLRTSSTNHLTMNTQFPYLVNSLGAEKAILALQGALENNMTQIWIPCK